MKTIKKIIVSVIALSLATCISASSIVETAGKSLSEPVALFKSIKEEKAELLQGLKNEKKMLEAEKSATIKNITTDIEETKNKKTAVEQELEKNPDDEFLVKKLSLLTETYDALRDISRIWEGLLKKISDHITLLEKYITDPELKGYATEVKISAGPYFFEDLEDAHQKMISQQRFVEQLRRRKENVLKDQKNLMQALEKAIEEYKDKKTKREDFNKSPADNKAANVPFSLSTAQRAELLALENNLYKLKLDVAQLHLREKRQEVAFIDNELFVEMLHLDVLEDVVQKIKSSITVTAEQIEIAFQELDKKKQIFSALKAKYNDEINKLRQISQVESKKLTALSVRSGIQLGNELNTWGFEPKKTLESYRSLAEVGATNAYLLLLNEQEAYFETLLSLEQEKINYAEDVAKVKETYYKIMSRKFASEDEIGQEIRKYTARQAAHEAMLKSYKTKKEEIDASLVKLQSEVLPQLKKRKIDIAQQRDGIFKGNINQYAATLNLLEKAEEYVLFRVEVVTAIGKACAETMSILDKIIGHTKFIFAQLESITIWYRPEYAITWDGIQSMDTDVKTFFVDLHNYFWQFDKDNLIEKAQDLFKHPLQLFFTFILVVALVGCSLFVQRFGPGAAAYLGTIGEQMPNARLIALLLAMVIGFVSSYVMSMAVWAGTFIFVKYIISDPYLLILLYLVSIPYLVYLARQAIDFLFSFNSNNKYFLISQDSQLRFNIILSVLLYATIVLMLFREAFMLAAFTKSELPSILLTVSFIILQVSLIFSISKEQVLNIIPASWERLYRAADRYYYVAVLLLIAIIILSNPYVGYLRLVLYLVWGLVRTLILLKILHWGHLLVKRAVSLIFFSTQEEVVRERFAYAKTWYGIAIIFSFLFFVCVGIIIGAKIWGWPIGISDLIKWLEQPILGIGKDTRNPLTSITILTILLFILAGFIIAFAVNRFVLEKVFDLMLVDSGMQNAITNLTRYVLVAAAVLLGFQAAGYGGLITYMYLLIIGIGYIVQNPLHDLIAYFIILMQRPIKVGDYIQVEEDVCGVVRKITPKSVTLRRKNSTTIVVPNAQIINKPITNWNYARNFIAFNDILINIRYKEDPAKVKDLLLSAVDAHPKILKNPKPVIRLDNFNENGYLFMVRGYLSSNFTLEQWEIASDVRLAIVKILRENGIEIAMPVRIMLNSSASDDDNKDYGNKMGQ